MIGRTMPAGAAAADRLGRHAEAEGLERLVDDVRVRGSAVVLRGEPGIGKSALLDHARLYAVGQNVRVLETAGVQSETQVAFSGLHQLLHPVMHRADELLAPQHEALLCAFGQSDREVPELSRISIAALSLLAEVASEQALLIVADDLQWLDRASASVLTFIARRVESDPIVVLGATRDGSHGPFDSAGLAEVPLTRLNDGDAAQLLDRQGHVLGSGVRERLLAEAAGNPLALIELPATVGHHVNALLPALLPLTERLQRAFTERLRDLPEATRTVLLAAALSKDGALKEVLSAVIQVDAQAGLHDIDPAVRARLTTVEGRYVHFRHPLVRSAVQHAAATSERYAMHRAFAATLSGESAERIWHRSAATLEADPELAAELEALAAVDVRRGALEAAVAALERAAELTEAPADRGRRTLRAATLALHLGRRDVVRRLLADSDDLDLTPADVGRRIWIRATVDPPAPGTRQVSWRWWTPPSSCGRAATRNSPSTSYKAQPP